MVMTLKMVELSKSGKLCKAFGRIIQGLFALQSTSECVWKSRLHKGQPSVATNRQA